ncbi:MAG TPA: NAD(P)(+) transhydrogenase (Re/Si-specific) subunit beta [Candidatus Dormibacteraeota bacterium]|nr:NAD(P)(+) transhydrogenase (Re/Si-specific) subunit beta [Candidatus Dormibacteraeota bacterium]
MSGSAPAWVTFTYIVTAMLFVVAIKRLRSVRSARSGNRLAMVGMGIAVVVVCQQAGLDNWSLIYPPMIVGAAIGTVAARQVKMTAMPQMVALFNGMGAGAAALIAAADFRRLDMLGSVPRLDGITILLSCMIGSIGFAGSMVAFAKLQELIGGRPLVYPLQKPINAAILATILVLGAVIIARQGGIELFVAFAVLSLVLGPLFVLPIGGADMPVVISLLNSFTGVAAAITGFVLDNQVLVVSGALVGASGTVLTQLMSRAMNRPLSNILFGAFGAVTAAGAGGAAEAGGEVRSATVEDVVALFELARLVIVVPGYGLAVARAQHDVKRLADQLEARGIEVKYAIHPVAGRMPGHMNVLLAEADVPYSQLYDMDAINDEFSRADVAVVIGANDVVNPAARNDPGSPIHGMPILNVDQAANVVVLKRSMNPGFAGIENHLFYDPKTVMLFGDAQKSVSELVTELKEAS